MGKQMVEYEVTITTEGGAEYKFDIKSHDIFNILNDLQAQVDLDDIKDLTPISFRAKLK